jgi:FecR protein
MTETEDQKLAHLVRQAGHRTPLPEDARRRFEAAFRRELGSSRRKQLRSRFQIGCGIAAGIALVTLMLLIRNQPVEAVVIATVKQSHGQTFWLNDDEGGPLRPGNRIQQNDIIRTSEGSLALQPDGGGVDIRLTRMTEIEFTSAQSMRLLEGSVYVDADASPLPFTILADGVQVDHLGTQYLVSSTERGISVAVREGEVMIVTRQVKHRSRARQNAGELIEFQDDDNFTVSRIMTYDERWAWTNTLAQDIETDGMYLVDFLTWAARETGYSVAYASADIMQAVQYKGKDTRALVLLGNHRTEDVFKALEAVMRTTQFSASIGQGVITIGPA